MTRSTRCLALLLLCLSAPTPSRAQASRGLNALGYGAVGAAVGVAATANASCEGSGFICIPPETVLATIGGGLVGTILGSRLASGANAAVDEGRPLSSAHVAGITVGTLLGGATLGAIVSIPFISPDGEGTIFGSDEQTLGILMAAGAALGASHLWRHWGELTGGGLAVRPGIMPDGQPGVAARLRL